jgi:diaminopimelate decarboxylase
MPDVRSSYTDSVQFFTSSSPHDLARRFGTPLYVYNESILRRSCRDLLALSSHPGFRVNYSAKANSNPVLLRIIREEGCLADAMSPGELQSDMMAGFAPNDVLYVCNNVSADELRAAVDCRVLVSVDSLSQLDLYGRVNPGGRVMIRINPGIGEGHGTKVITGGENTKFGIKLHALDEILSILNRHDLRLAGINQHIGSLFMEPDGYLAAADVMLDFVTALPPGLRAQLEIIDFGGGFGIPYRKYEEEKRLDLTRLGRELHRRMEEFCSATGYAGRFYVEPGRYVVAECGLLLGTVHATKQNGAVRYAGTDIGFNVLMRPVLYDAFHDIEVYRAGGAPDARPVRQTLVGNICESGDMLAKDRPLPEVQEGDLIGVLDAGAYGFSMASAYNQRPRPAEVLLEDDGKVRLIRRRETPEDMNCCLIREEN